MKICANCQAHCADDAIGTVTLTFTAPDESSSTKSKLLCQHCAMIVGATFNDSSKLMILGNAIARAIEGEKELDS